MTPQCHRGGRSSFSDLQEVAIEVIRADNLMAETAIELHFVPHVAALRGWTSKLAVHSSGSFHRPSKLDRRRERGFGFGGHGVRRGSSPFVPVRTTGGTQSSTWTKRSNDPPSRSTTARSEYR